MEKKYKITQNRRQSFGIFFILAFLSYGIESGLVDSITKILSFLSRACPRKKYLAGSQGRRSIESAVYCWYMSISSTAERRITVKDEFWDRLYLEPVSNLPKWNGFMGSGWIDVCFLIIQIEIGSTIILILRFYWIHHFCNRDDY